ncbi:MAG: cell wall hydrolase [bacterium]|nr:cell wall hydrolase [bacterium]
MKLGVTAMVTASLVISSHIPFTMPTLSDQVAAANNGKAAVQVTENVKKETTNSIPKQYKIKLKTTGNLNLRKKASYNSDKICVIKGNTQVYAEKLGGEYVHVYVNGKTGYLYAQRLEQNGKAITYKKEVKKSTASTSNTKAGNRWGISLTQSEKKLLAQITYLEAGDQSDLGEQAVIVVIFNRMKNSEYKGSLQSVLSRPGQFTTWKNRNRANPGKREYKNIEVVLSGQSKANDWKYLYFNMGHGKFKYGDHYFS